MFEAVWATALGYSQGFTQPVPTVVFAIGILASTAGLAVAMKHIPVGSAYAVWTAVGSALTVSWAMVVGDEKASVLKVLFLAGIIACVVGLKISSNNATGLDETPQQGSFQVKGNQQ